MYLCEGCIIIFIYHFHHYNQIGTENPRRGPNEHYWIFLLILSGLSSWFVHNSKHRSCSSHYLCKSSIELYRMMAMYVKWYIQKQLKGIIWNQTNVGRCEQKVFCKMFKIKNYDVGKGSRTHLKWVSNTQYYQKHQRYNISCKGLLWAQSIHWFHFSIPNLDYFSKQSNLNPTKLALIHNPSTKSWCVLLPH